MRVNCWNGCLFIRADNDQDALWLTEFIKKLDNSDLFSGHIELEMGRFGYDGELEIFDSWFSLKGIKPKIDGDSVFVETNRDTHVGEDSQVVGLRFSYINDWTSETWTKILQREIKASTKK